MPCWTQSYDTTDGSPSPYKMIYEVVLMRPYDVKHDKTQQVIMAHPHQSGRVDSIMPFTRSALG